MALIPMTQLLDHAMAHNYAVGYFESWNLESLLAVVDAAEEAGSPVIIGFNGGFLANEERYRKENICHYGRLGVEVAQRARVPMALILNEAEDVSVLVKGLHAGFNAVMYADENAPLEHLIRVNQYLVRTAHYFGAAVEAEVGELPMVDISTNTISSGNRTVPKEAKYFVEQTGVDALAVAVGNVHLLEGKKQHLDLELVYELSQVVDIPLVLHGGTGADPVGLQQAIRLGIRKVNFGTGLKRAYLESLRESLEGSAVKRMDAHDLVGRGGCLDIMTRARRQVADEVVKWMRVLGSCGQVARWNRGWDDGNQNNHAF